MIIILCKTIVLNNDTNVYYQLPLEVGADMKPIVGGKLAKCPIWYLNAFTYTVRTVKGAMLNFKFQHGSFNALVLS